MSDFVISEFCKAITPLDEEHSVGKNRSPPCATKNTARWLFVKVALIRRRGTIWSSVGPSGRALRPHSAAAFGSLFVCSILGS